MTKSAFFSLEAHLPPLCGVLFYLPQKKPNAGIFLPGFLRPDQRSPLLSLGPTPPLVGFSLQMYFFFENLPLGASITLPGPCDVGVFFTLSPASLPFIPKFFLPEDDISDLWEALPPLTIVPSSLQFGPILSYSPPQGPTGGRHLRLVLRRTPYPNSYNFNPKPSFHGFRERASFFLFLFFLRPFHLLRFCCCYSPSSTPALGVSCFFC